MNTQIAKIEGVENSVLTINQFYGGKKHGLCLSFVGNSCEGYAELNKAQVQELVKELQNWLGEVELPFYTKTRPSEQEKYWCSECKHYCTTACCDHYDKEGNRIR